VKIRDVPCSVVLGGSGHGGLARLVTLLSLALNVMIDCLAIEATNTVYVRSPICTYLAETLYTVSSSYGPQGSQ